MSGRLGWGLALKLAHREMRPRPDARGLAGFRIFLLCLTLGIFTIAGVGSLSSALIGGMVAQGQSILGGDIDVRLVQRPASEKQRAYLKNAGGFSEIATMRAMVRPMGSAFDNTMLVEAKAVDATYPHYGAVALSNGQSLEDALSMQDGVQKIYGAVAEQGLFDRLEIEEGTRLVLGDIIIELRGVLVHSS